LHHVEPSNWLQPGNPRLNKDVTMKTAWSMGAANQCRIRQKLGLFESACSNPRRETTMPHSYDETVAKLLTYGACDYGSENETWPDYLALDFTGAHVPELIRMVSDSDLNGADQDSPHIWAPTHAWRALGQLRAETAAGPLVRLFEQFKHDDWLNDELPEVFSLIGPAAIPALAEFLGDDRVEEICRISVPACLEGIALTHAESRDACTEALARQLERYETNGDTLNAFLILSLTKLEATEAIGLIRRAFADDCVDLIVQGDVEDVELELGLRRQRSTPRRRLDPFGLSALRDLLALPPTPIRHPAKTGRNAPCPCGSGKKFKKCCLNAPPPTLRAGVSL
jgi:hypothetical protein